MTIFERDVKDADCKQIKMSTSVYPALSKPSSAPEIISLINSIPIIIISSKPLSKRTRDILNDAGKLKEFNYDKYCTWSISHFISSNNPDFIFFDITIPDVLGYIQNNFADMPTEKLIILKHSHEDIHEAWIEVIRSKIPNIPIITHIPEIRDLGDLTKQLISTIAIPEPVSRVKKIMKAIFSCISQSL